MYAVVPHSINGKPTHRGFVVRTMPLDNCDYRGVEPIKVYKIRSAAEKYAEKL